MNESSNPFDLGLWVLEMVYASYGSLPLPMMGCDWGMWSHPTLQVGPRQEVPAPLRLNALRRLFGSAASALSGAPAPDLLGDAASENSRKESIPGVTRRGGV